MEDNKVSMSHFSGDTITKLKNVLPVESNFYNPVDIIGDAPPDRYEKAIDILLSCPDSEVAGVIILLTPQSQTNPLGVANLCKELHKKHPKKVMVGAFIGGVSVEEPSKLLNKEGVPTYAFPEDAVKHVDHICNLVRSVIAHIHAGAERFAPRPNHHSRQVLAENRRFQ